MIWKVLLLKAIEIPAIIFLPYYFGRFLESKLGNTNKMFDCENSKSLRWVMGIACLAILLVAINLLLGFLRINIWIAETYLGGQYEKSNYYNYYNDTINLIVHVLASE